MTLAQELGAKTSELRAAVNLARLRQMDGDGSDDGRSMLTCCLQLVQRRV